MPDTISCEAADLAAAAKCFDCLNEQQAKTVMLYLLREVANLRDQTPAQLVQSAKCVCGMPSNLMDSVMVYLACKAVEALEA